MKNQTGRSRTPRDELARSGRHYLPKAIGTDGEGGNSSVQWLGPSRQLEPWWRAFLWELESKNQRLSNKS